MLKTKQRLLTLVMVLIFIANVLPTMAFADELSTEQTAETAEIPDALSVNVELTDEAINMTEAPEPPAEVPLAAPEAPVEPAPAPEISSPEVVEPTEPATPAPAPEEPVIPEERVPEVDSSPEVDAPTTNPEEITPEENVPGVDSSPEVDAPNTDPEVTLPETNIPGVDPSPEADTPNINIPEDKTPDSSEPTTPEVNPGVEEPETPEKPVDPSLPDDSETVKPDENPEIKDDGDDENNKLEEKEPDDNEEEDEEDTKMTPYGPCLTDTIKPALDWVDPASSLYSLYHGQFNILGIALQQFNSYDSCEDSAKPGMVKYNIWYYGNEELANKIGALHTNPYIDELNWNTTFISWCANELGYIDLGIFPCTNDSTELLNFLQAKNSKHLVKGEAGIAAEAITPNDLIFIPVNNNYIVGIVESSNAQSISYLAGDINNMVCLNSIDISLLPEGTEIFSLDKAEDFYYEYLDFMHNEMNLPYNAAVGVMANLYAESKFMPHANGDFGTSYGLCQWHNERWFSLIDFCGANGLDWQTTEGQLHFLKYELETNHSGLYEYLQNCGDASDAAYEFCVQFEKPADTIEAGHMRSDIAMQILVPTIF